MKHAFLIMAHKQPELIERIVEKIEAQNHFIYIHYDAKSPDFNRISNIRDTHRNITVLDRMNVRWGMFSQTLCELNGFRSMFSSENRYDYYHLISGQDYPCVTVDTFDSFFEKNAGTSFMKLDTEDETIEYRKKKFPYRLENWYLNDKLDASILGVKLYKIFNRLTKIIPRPYRAMNSVWGGWNWCSVTRDVLEYCLVYLDEHPEYVRRFRYTLASDELILATIIKPVAEKMNVDINNSLRFVEWNPRRYSKTLPLILNELEYEDIVNSGAFFCRKVQLPESEELLEMIDNKLLMEE